MVRAEQGCRGAGRWAGGGAEFECMHSKSRAPNVNRDTAGRKPRQLLSRPSGPRRVVHRLSSASSSHARMPAMESALETSAMMSGQLVASATVSSMLISLPLGRIPRHSAATGHEPVLGPDRGTEVDARARAAVLRAAPTNRELTVRADRRERAEKLRQARHGRAEDDVQVAVHVQNNNNKSIS